MKASKEFVNVLTSGIRLAQDKFGWEKIHGASMWSVFYLISDSVSPGHRHNAKLDMPENPAFAKERADLTDAQIETAMKAAMKMNEAKAENMTREHLLEAVEFRPVNIRLADGSLKTITKAEDVAEDIAFESIEEIYPKGFDELSERVVVKRRYGASPEVAISSHGPLRNDVLEFVGNKFVTETELQAFFNKLDEERGKKLNYKKWFNENQKFFESYTLKGTKVWSLSKIGKRAFEHVIDRRSSNTVNERMVLSYDEFILNEELDVPEESIEESIKTPVKKGTVQKVIELALKHLKPKVTEDEVVKQLAGVMSLEDLYDKAVKLISPDQVSQFETAFPSVD
jgi:hypothetical protein